MAPALKRKNPFDGPGSPQKRAAIGSADDQSAAPAIPAHSAPPPANVPVPLSAEEQLKAKKKAERASYPSSLPRQKKYGCDDCDKRFTRPCHLEEHKLKAHATGPPPFSCPIEGCSYAGHSKQKLSEHMKRHGPANRQCVEEGCGKKFTTEEQLNRHMKVHKVNPLACTYIGCLYKAHNPEYLEAHINAVHLGVAGWVCSEIDPVTGQACGRAYQRKTAFNRHMKHDHATYEVKCQRCVVKDGEAHTGFANTKQLKEHLMAIHNGCQVCDESFDTYEDLKVHVASEHLEENGNPRALCRVPGCGHTFSREDTEKKHYEKVHEKVNEPNMVQAQKTTYVSPYPMLVEPSSSPPSPPSPPPARKTRKNAHHKPTMLEQLTGTHMAKRPIGCDVPGCPIRFLTERFREEHMMIAHLDWLTEQGC